MKTSKNNTSSNEVKNSPINNVIINETEQTVFLEGAKVETKQTVSINVTQKTVSELTSGKKDYTNHLKGIETNLDNRIKLMQSEAYKPIAIPYLNAANVKKEDFNKPYIFGCYCQLLINEKVYFCKIVKLNEKNLLTIDTLEKVINEKVISTKITFSILEKGFLIGKNEKDITLTKLVGGENTFYTLQIITTLSFNEMLTKLAMYKKELNRLKMQTEKAEKVKILKIDFSKMTTEEFNIWKSSQAV